ncbi:MAG: Hint domain-containing protein [Pseudomonadota bacterium]
MAQYDLAWLDTNGAATWDRRSLTETPEVEAAVSSLARGAMLRGTRGPVAVEDLIPGDRVATRGGGTAQIDWIGARTYSSSAERPVFYRVSARAFGAAGPEASVLLGEHAYVLIDNPRCRELVGGALAYAPIAAFEDGVTVTALSPPGEVTVYGLACARQEALIVEGLPVESYHPARATTRTLTRGVLSDMGKLFPQLGAGDGFGAARIPHLSMSEAQALSLTGG